MEFDGIPLKYISNINSSDNDLPILFIDVHLRPVVTQKLHTPYSISNSMENVPDCASLYRK